MLIRLLTAALVAAVLAMTTTGAHAQTYDVALDAGDVLITWCGGATEVTAFGPSAALVACTKGVPSEAVAGEADGLLGGLIYFIDLNTGDDIGVTCTGALAIYVDGQTATTECGL